MEQKLHPEIVETHTHTHTNACTHTLVKADECECRWWSETNVHQDYRSSLTCWAVHTDTHTHVSNHITLQFPPPHSHTWARMNIHSLLACKGAGLTKAFLSWLRPRQRICRCQPGFSGQRDSGDWSAVKLNDVAEELFQETQADKAHERLLSDGKLPPGGVRRGGERKPSWGLASRVWEDSDYYWKVRSDNLKCGNVKIPKK